LRGNQVVALSVCRDTCRARRVAGHAFCSACLLPAAPWCCRFVLGHPLVASAVVGASTLQQLQELLQAAAQGPLQDDQLLAAIDSIHQRYPNPTP
jgi:N-acetyltransferase 10